MINEIKKLMDDYIVWLRNKTKLRQVDDCVEITTPYLDRHNDYMQIYAQRENGGFVLTDDGYTIDDLRLSGCELESKKRKDLLTLTLNGFGVKFDNDRLLVHASPENFAVRKHNLMQAMLAVNDLFYLSGPVVASLFLEDVESWLNVHDIRYTPRVKFTGKSGYDHLFDFVIPASKKQPERILQAINHPDRNAAQKVAFSWIDTKEVRPSDSQAYSFLNDSEFKPSAVVLDAMNNYDVHPVLWSKREEVRELLAA